MYPLDNLQIQCVIWLIICSCVSPHCFLIIYLSLSRHSVSVFLLTLLPACLLSIGFSQGTFPSNPLFLCLTSGCFLTSPPVIVNSRLYDENRQACISSLGLLELTTHLSSLLRHQHLNAPQTCHTQQVPVRGIQMGDLPISHP